MNKVIRFRIELLIQLVGYVVRVRPDSALVVLIGIVSSALEVTGLMVLVPLTRLAAHIPIAASSPWNRIPILLGLHPTAQFYVIAFFALLFARTVTQLAVTILVSHINRGMSDAFSTRALEAFIHHLDFAQVQKGSIGHFVSIAGDEAVRAAMMVTSVIRLVPLLVLFLLYLAMISYQSWQAGAGFVLFCLFVLVCLFGAFKKSLVLGARAVEQSREAGTHFIESLSGLRTVRSFNAENYVTRRYAQMMTAYVRTLFLGDALSAIGGAVPTLFLTAGMLIAVTLFLPAKQLVILLPAIIVGIMMVLRLLPLATQALDVLMHLTTDLKAGESVSEMLGAVKSLDEMEGGGPKNIVRPIARIEFHKVSFRYEDKLPWVLHDFSVNFVAGKSYAVKGASGAGKSTIIDLLLKFYEPQKGSILINGEDIAVISSKSLRRQIALVEQTTRIFFDTINYNVRFGLEASSDEVLRSLEMAELQDLLQRLPHGQSSLLNFQGSNVSGGQRQRIGLARALLRSADVLILDESTSALDVSCRKRILDTLLDVYCDRILVFVTHDPYIVERVDEVIQLHPLLEAAHIRI